MIIIKTDHEVDKMKDAGKIVAECLSLVGENIRPGIKTIELDNIASKFIRKCGAVPSFKDYNGFPANICVSINDEVVHGIPSERLLNEGDIVSADIGAIYKGYQGDAARTFAVGKISDKAQNLIDVTKQSFYEGIKYAVIGKRLYDISHAIQEYVEKNGFSIVRDYVGHGIGRDMHEDPPIPNYGMPGRGPRLRKGMTLAIEPMVNEGDYSVYTLPNEWTVVTSDASLAAHYENTIAITDGEPIILTKI